ncbi:MAG: NADH-quinone oxidoreductase subunit NuoH [Opitutales bacterium]
MDVLSVSLTIAKAVAVVVVLMSFCAYAVLAERKVSAWIQGRVGPNRTTLPLIGAIPVIGPFLTRLGIFQPAADGLKFLFKEDVIPGHVNKFYYVLAPALALIPALTTVAVLPFGQFIDAAGEVQPLVLAHLDIGILFVLAVSSLGVYGIVIAGWASNSKYPFLGGIRASAQLISYELAMGLSILPVFMWSAGTGELGLSLFQVVESQGSLWMAIWQPFSALIFMVALFAETNRLPFDMPEAETELVGGFHTEYSSFKFGLFFVAEYAHVIIGSAVMVVLFFGGWHPLPFVPLHIEGLLGGVLSVLIFLAKVLALVFFFIWIRWTLPRFRYDQVMNLGWKILLPLALANLVFNAILIAIIDTAF